jgi:protein SCO1
VKHAPGATGSLSTSVLNGLEKTHWRTSRQWHPTIRSSLLLLTLTTIPRVACGQSQDPALKLINEIGIVQKLDAQIPLDLEFRDETGRTVKLADYFGQRPVVLNLAYYECPMLCNMTRDGLVKTLRTMTFMPGKEFNVLTVSFDARENSKLAARAKRKTMTFYGRDDVADGWHFLTGDKPAIERLTQSVGFRYAWDDNGGRYAHAAGIIVLTPEGRVSRYLNGVEFEARDLRLALVEASAGKIGSPSDQVLLYCYQYDPMTGRYGLAIMNALRAGGAAIVLLLFGGIGILIVRERRSQRGRVLPGGDATTVRTP